MLATNVGGGLAGPSLISYDVAPDDCQLRLGVVVTPIVLSPGFGELGVGGPLLVGGGGGGGGAADAPTVVNDHTGPGVVPLLFFATICQ